MSQFSLFDKIILIVLGLSLPVLAWEGINFYWYKTRIEAGNYPKILEDFPVHQATFEDYRSAQNKIESFIEAVLKDEATDIVLSKDEINSLVTKGIQLDKYKPGTYLHYHVDKDFIEEKYLQWPSSPGVKGCRTRRAIIKFTTSESGNPQEVHRTVMEYEREWKKSAEFYRNLEVSTLIRFIFGLSQSPAMLLNTDAGTVQFQRGKTAIDKISNVHIQDGYLYISTH